MARRILRSTGRRQTTSGRQLAEASKRGRPATERTLLLIETLVSLGRPGALKELAALQGIPQSSAFRLCERLEQEGYVVREAGTRRYAIGVRLMRLGLGIVQSSGPASSRHQILTDLVAELGETCNLTTLAGTEVLYLDRVETKWPLRLLLEPGSRVPIHCTASGKLFLATMPASTLDQVLASLQLPAMTPSSITNVAALRRELKQIARKGYSTDDEEFLLGLAAVAVPVKDRRGRVLAAVACHAPKARVNLKQLVARTELLKAAATRLANTFDPN